MNNINIKHNPQKTRHPDLFTVGHSNTPVYTPLDSMTDEELESCVPSDFSDSEWKELCGDDRYADVLPTIIDNNQLFIEHVDNCVTQAIQDEIERLRQPAEAKRVFIAEVKDPYEDVYAMHMRDGEKFIKEHGGGETGEFLLSELLMDTNNWDLFWNETDRKVTGKDKYGTPVTVRYDWDHSFEESVTLDVVFSGDDIVRFDRLTDAEKETILSGIDGSSVDGKGERNRRGSKTVLNCMMDIDEDKSPKITVEFEMPGYYVGEVRWSSLDKSDISDISNVAKPSIISRYIAAITSEARV